MGKSFALLISLLAAAALMTGCAQVGGAPSPEKVDMQSAKKLKMPIVIYHVGVEHGKDGSSRPVVYFVNSSGKPVDLATFFVQGTTADGKTVTLWADDYEKVAPGDASKNGVLGGKWNNTDVKCISIKQAGLHINGKDTRYSEQNINQLFQDPSINSCK
jgi:hypothetical protein